MDRIRHATRVLSVRGMTPEDLEFLRHRSVGPRLKRLRDTHHAVARLIAVGKRIGEVAFLTGFSTQRVGTLLKDPAFIELVERYRGDVNESWREGVDEYQQMAMRNMAIAERQLTDRLEAADDAGETLPTRELIAITADRADRFGYGKRSTQLNVNVDFAAKLERAINRSKTIEGKALEE